jgi:hypothetical protein
VNSKKVRRLMRENGLQPKRRRRLPSVVILELRGAEISKRRRFR